MAVPPEAAVTVTMAIAIVTCAVQYYASRRAGTWFFTFGLLCTGAIAISAIAILPGTAWPQAQAVADVGILVAGCAAFGSSAWLHFAFKMAGDPDDG
jgi:hypothetical protein